MVEVGVTEGDCDTEIDMVLLLLIVEEVLPLFDCVFLSSERDEVMLALVVLTTRLDVTDDEALAVNEGETSRELETEIDDDELTLFEIDDS